jgi:hypothetical protein
LHKGVFYHCRNHKRVIARRAVGAVYYAHKHIIGGTEKKTACFVDAVDIYFVFKVLRGNIYVPVQILFCRRDFFPKHIKYGNVYIGFFFYVLYYLFNDGLQNATSSGGAAFNAAFAVCVNYRFIAAINNIILYFTDKIKQT